MSANPFSAPPAYPNAGDSTPQNPFANNLGNPQPPQDPWNPVSPGQSYQSAPVYGSYGAPGSFPSPESSVQQQVTNHQNPFVAQNVGSPIASISLQPAPPQQAQPLIQGQPSGTQFPNNHTSPENPFLASIPSSAIVTSQYQSNPYATSMPNQGGAMIVSQTQSSPYGNPFGNQQYQPVTPNENFSYGGSGMQQQSNQPQAQTSHANPFDPFQLAPPVPSLAPPSQHFLSVPPENSVIPGRVPDFSQTYHPTEYNRPHADSAGSEPGFPQTGVNVSERRSSFGGAVNDGGFHDEQKIAPVNQPAPPSDNRNTDGYERRNADEPRQTQAPQTLHTSYDYGQRPDVPPDNDPREKESPRNKYALQLARMAPPGASPLPKADLVRKRGFVLSRISFRTIVMKKWKQSYWVQYGPHTMLWFRAQSDFDDWLNNPYHSQAERNFLIKLAVNFVHDLYKPNVRGYQVTQARTKGYGNKLVRQFKLERWMDYGPTIAAAFGSYNPKEVDDLREALVECMRNTPLNNGIRATGAVRQQPPENIQTQRSESPGKFCYRSCLTAFTYNSQHVLFVRNFSSKPCPRWESSRRRLQSRKL